MSAYLLVIVGSVLVSAILTAVIPSGKTANVIKGVTKAVCLLAILSPVPGILAKSGWLEENENYFSQPVIQTDTSFIKYYSEMRIQNAEELLEKEILDKYSLGTDVTLIWQYADANIDTDNIKILQICVQILQPYDGERKMEVKEYLMKNYCSEVMIE